MTDSGISSHGHRDHDNPSHLRSTDKRVMNGSNGPRKNRAISGSGKKLQVASSFISKEWAILEGPVEVSDLDATITLNLARPL